uniref:Uncharacterized protein n=1 Tax=Arion vulgaris TaxID=1028688 RepID=A0A0B7B748_9EUPU
MFRLFHAENEPSTFGLRDKYCTSPPQRLPNRWISTGQNLGPSRAVQCCPSISLACHPNVYIVP